MPANPATLHYTNYNGKLMRADIAAVPAGNSAQRYGNGLFETMLVQQGVVRLAAYHWERLFSGLAQLQFVIPPHFDDRMLEAQVLRTVAKNNMTQLCRVRLQVFGSSGGIFGPDDDKVHYVIECYPLNSTDLLLNENGLVLGIAQGLAKSADSLGNLKSCNALIYAMAARQAKNHQWNDALIVNTAGNIIESSKANIFWVRDGITYTPPLSEGCIAGTMRRYLLQAAGNIQQKPLTAGELRSASEVFITNAIKGIRWVRHIGDTGYTCSTARKLYTLLPA